MLICPHCGSPHQRPGARFCAACGRPLPPGGPTPPFGTVVMGSPGAAQLIVRYPGGVEQSCPITRSPMTIGRASDNDVVVNFATVSRHHAQLVQQGAGYKIVDRQSVNGLYVGGRRAAEHTLRNGDEVRIPDALGNSVVLVFRDTSAPLPAAPPPVVGQVPLHGRPRVTIGRDTTNDLPLNYPTISRHHASVDADGRGGYAISDLGSTNGTFVNSRRVRREQLKPGDQIQIGPFKLLYDGVSLHVVTQSRQVRLDGLGLTRVVRGRKTILNDVSLSIHPGDFVALVGGSGAGKTTLMNALSGFQPATGQVLINGEDFYQAYDAYRSMIGYVPQDDIIHPGLPVGNALRYVAKLRLPPDTSRADIERRIDEVLRAVDLMEQKKQVISSLSGGQRKRVSIAVELLADPALLFLDEPTSGLDPGLEKRMMGLLQRLADEGRTVILVTHATANIDLADYVGFMAHGHLAFFGPPVEAQQFFQAQDFADIYEKLSERIDPQRGPVAQELVPYFQQVRQQYPQARPTAGRLWEAHFKRSPYYQQHVQSRLPSTAQPQPPAPAPDTKAPRASSLRQLWLLTRRYLELVRRDWLSLFVLLAVMPFIGGLLLIIANPEDLVGKSQSAIEQIMAKAGTQTYVAFGDAQKLLLMIALATVLLGIFGAAYEVIKESAIYKRERMVNLRILPYISSKVFVLLGFGLIQCLALLAVIALKVRLPTGGVLMWAPLEMYITLTLAVLAAIWLGLLISALIPRRDMVIYVVLLVLFLQIIFAGAIFKLPDVAKPLSWATITYWTLDSLGSTVDMQQLDNLRASKFQFNVEIENPVTKEKKTEERQERQKPPTARADSDVNYGHTAKHLLSRWAILGLFSVLFGVATTLAMKLRDRR